MPAFSPDTLVNDPFSLLGYAVPVFTPDAGISPETEPLQNP
jgi:hypothetical protein